MGTNKEQNTGIRECFMNCPLCNWSLSKLRYHEIEVDVCRRCNGIWFDQGELKEYIDDMLMDKTDIPNSPVHAKKPPVVGQAQIKEPVNECPRCRQPMNHFNYCYDSNIILDKCPVCGGIWVGGGKLEKMVEYHKVNPYLEGMGKGLAKQVDQHNKMQSLADFR